MTTLLTRADDEAMVRARIDGWARAVRARDVDGMMACYAPDIVSFDCHTNLRIKGAAGLRRHLDTSMSRMQGPMVFEIHELDVAAENEVAFGHYLARCGCTGPDGDAHVGWLRATVGLRRANGKWLIAHDHCSAPFDADSGNTLFGLTPVDRTRPL